VRVRSAQIAPTGTARPYDSGVENDSRQPPYYIASIDHALRLLLMLKSRSRIRVADAADELGVARSTAHRVLGMLVYRGFAVQDPGSRAYRAGPVLVEVGMGALAQLDVRQRARPHLEHVAALTGETTSLQILDGTQARFVDSVESVNAVRVGSRAGVSLPAHIASGGKAMLACLSERALLTLYPSDDLGPPLTPATITSRADLLAELATARERGYAVNYGGSASGLVAVGVAVRGSDQVPVAALTTAAPVTRMDPAKMLEIARALQEAAREMEGHLSKPAGAKAQSSG
jgi:DNA-binding IclR family transcriptional regulator